MGHEDIYVPVLSGVIAHCYLDCLTIYTFLCCLQLWYTLSKHPCIHIQVQKESPTINQQTTCKIPLDSKLFGKSIWSNHQWTQHYNQQICNFFNQLSCMGMIIAWVLVPYQAHSAHYLENKSTIVNFITINTYPLFFRMWSTSSFGSLG